MSVFASPGTPSSMQWPLLKSAISNSSITWSCPTMTRVSCFLMSSNADFSFWMESMSDCAMWPGVLIAVGSRNVGKGDRV